MYCMKGLHEDHQKNNTLKSEELTEGIDDKIHHQKAVLDQEHRPVSGQGELHAQVCNTTMATLHWRRLTEAESQVDFKCDYGR